jgi:hypothetical protein
LSYLYPRASSWHDRSFPWRKLAPGESLYAMSSLSPLDFYIRTSSWHVAPGVCLILALGESSHPLCLPYASFRGSGGGTIIVPPLSRPKTGSPSSDLVVGEHARAISWRGAAPLVPAPLPDVRPLLLVVLEGLGEYPSRLGSRIWHFRAISWRVHLRPHL